MSNKADKLFKEKLGEHSLPPSAQAWGKIEANLAKKNKGIIWFRIAAVLALVGLLTFVWVRNEKDTAPQMAKHHLIKTEQEKPATIEEQKEKQVLPSIAQQTAKEEKESKTVSKKKNSNTIKQEPVSTKINNEQPTVALVEEKKEELPAIKNEVNTAQVKTQKSIKLTFSLPSLIKADVNETEQAIAATAPEEKKSTLQKAVNDIRTGDVLGSLRDAKDDLFAWEFKKDKTKKSTLN